MPFSLICWYGYVSKYEAKLFLSEFFWSTEHLQMLKVGDSRSYVPLSTLTAWKKYPGFWMLYLKVPINAKLCYSFFLLKMFPTGVQGSSVCFLMISSLGLSPQSLEQLILQNKPQLLPVAAFCYTFLHC